MAERTFDYNEIATIYQKMQTIIGDTNAKDSIAGILHELEQDFHQSVNVVDEAVYGDLGRQLLLDWDNTSVNFNEFIANFANWAALVTKASNKYEEFENQVANLKNSHPLGMAAPSENKTTTTSSYTDNYYK